MKKIKDYIILIVLLFAFVLTFKYSRVVKASVLASLELFMTSLVPSMLPMYFLIDLFLNFGLLSLLYKIFKNNRPLLLFISLLSGTPANAKYIKEFYEEGHIGTRDANFLLLFSYSPNPLFVLAFSPDFCFFLIVMGYLYLSNFLLYIFYRKRFPRERGPAKEIQKLSFIDCLSCSIAKSLNVLVLILGIVVFYGLINTFLSILGVNSILLYSILELTNALNILRGLGMPIFWVIFSITFGGLSIHTQIKSILEDTPISYRYFLKGRVLASIPILLFALFY